MYMDASYRGLNRFAETSSKPLPDYIFKSIKNSNRPSYWKPMPLDDDIYRNKTPLENTNPMYAQVKANHMNRYYENTCGLNENSPSILLAHEQYPLTPSRIYELTEEQMTGIKKPSYLNKVIKPETRNIIPYRQGWVTMTTANVHTNSKQNRTICNNFVNVNNSSTLLYNTSNKQINNNRDDINVSHSAHVKNPYEPIYQNQPEKVIVRASDPLKTLKTFTLPCNNVLKNATENSFYETSKYSYQKPVVPRNINATKVANYNSDLYNGNPEKNTYCFHNPYQNVTTIDYILNKNGKTFVHPVNVFEADVRPSINTNQMIIQQLLR